MTGKFISFPFVKIDTNQHNYDGPNHKQNIAKRNSNIFEFSKETQNRQPWSLDDDDGA